MLQISIDRADDGLHSVYGLWVSEDRVGLEGTHGCCGVECAEGYHLGVRDVSFLCTDHADSRVSYVLTEMNDVAGLLRMEFTFLQEKSGVSDGY